jgi:membrane-associated protein
MDASRTRTFLLGLVALAVLVGAGFAVGPDRIAQFVGQLKDLKGLIRSGGYPVLTLIVFAETGLLIGFFLPGDSLLVTAGILATPSLGVLDIGVLAALLIPAAILGDACNYTLGRRTGPKIFSRPDGWIFRKSHLERTQRFYAKYGGKTVVLARFLPIVRTFAPFAAGMAEMPYRKFLIFNVIGAVVWVLTMTMTGYLLAAAVPDIERHLHLVIAIVIAVSFVPGVVEVLRERRRLKREAQAGVIEARGDGPR